MHSRPGSGRNCSLRLSIVHKDSVFPRSWVVLCIIRRTERKRERENAPRRTPEAPKGHPISVNAVITSTALSSKTWTSPFARTRQMKENSRRRIRVQEIMTMIFKFQHTCIDRNYTREDNGALNQNFMRKVAPVNRVPRLLCRNE